MPIPFEEFIMAGPHRVVVTESQVYHRCIRCYRVDHPICGHGTKVDLVGGLCVALHGLCCIRVPPTPNTQNSSDETSLQQEEYAANVASTTATTAQANNIKILSCSQQYITYNSMTIDPCRLHIADGMTQAHELISPLHETHVQWSITRVL